MSTIIVDSENVKLCGFEELDDAAYFIFRKNGVVISKKASDGILLPQIKYSVTNGRINDKMLAEKLLERGFNMLNTFIYADGYYISDNPFDEVV